MPFKGDQGYKKLYRKLKRPHIPSITATAKRPHGWMGHPGHRKGSKLGARGIAKSPLGAHHGGVKGAKQRKAPRYSLRRLEI